MEKANNNTDFKGLFKDPKTKNFTSWVVGLTALMLAVFLGINQLLCIKDFGQLGDFFNGIAAPVLALITIVLLYNSFLVQKEELKAATKAIEQSTEEMKRSAEIMDRTEQNAKLERVESFTLKLLERYDVNRTNFGVYFENNKTIGIEALKHIKNYLFSEYLIHLYAHQHGAKNIPISGTKEWFDHVNKLLSSQFEILSSQSYYTDLKKLVYNLVAIYRSMLSSNLTKEELDHLRFAISTQISDIEFFFLKYFINQLKDLENLREPLDTNYGINSSSSSIYEMYIKKYLS